MNKTQPIKVAKPAGRSKSTPGGKKQEKKDDSKKEEKKFEEVEEPQPLEYKVN